MFVLVGQSGSLTGRRIPLQDGMVLGRNPETCDQEVRDPNASRRHMRFEIRNTQLTVYDLNSFNGTFVNEERIKGGRLLRTGDVVRMGETRFLITRQQTLVPKAPQKTMLGSLGQTMIGFSENDNPLNEKIVSLSKIQMRQGADAAQLEKRLTAVLKMSEAIGVLRSTEEVFSKILESLFEVFPQAQRGFLLLGKEIEELRPVAARDRQGKEGKFEISRSIVGRALKESNAVLYTEGGDDFGGHSILALEIRSAMVVPLVVKDEVLGVLSVDTDNPLKAFTANDLAVASAAASQASVALKNALLNEKIESDALVRQNLCRFLPTPLAAQAMEGKLDLKLGGSRCKGTIFFSDIVGFTSMAESLSPEEVVAILNEYFEVMVATITNHHGAIDKYLGDAIMAFWGIPLDQDGRAARNACLSALQMQNALWTFNYELIEQGKKPLQHGIGINSGDVVAGNLGAAQRVEYTIIGDDVNLAQRLESRAAGNQILISESTYQETQNEVLGILLQPSKVKGKQELLRILSLRGIVKDTESSLLHIPMVWKEGEQSLRVLANGFSQKGTGGLPELSIISPPDTPIRSGHLFLDIPEIANFPSFAIEVQQSQQIAEGENGRRCYTRSLATPIGWDPRLNNMLLQRQPLQSNLDLNAIKRH